MTVMNASIPLPTLRSHALLAFTIEFDHQAEGQINPLDDPTWRRLARGRDRGLSHS
jgi:hypothetical protein